MLYSTVIECRHQYTCFLCVFENLFIGVSVLSAMLWFNQCPFVLVLLFAESFILKKITSKHLGKVCSENKICVSDVL